MLDVCPIPSVVPSPRGRGRRALAVRAAGILLVSITTGLGGPSVSSAESDSPCSDQAILEIKPRVRLEGALELVRGGCLSVPGPIWTAIESGKWDDGVQISINDRVLLINTAVAKGYAEAESLSVAVLETGTLPGGRSIEPATGAMLLEGLAPALTAYRVGLMLDIYEQVSHPEVRNAVIRVLRNSEQPEALLPALDAHFEKRASANEARLTFSEQTDKDPDALLAGVIRALADGPALAWAVRLADAHESALAMKAARARGK